MGRRRCRYCCLLPLACPLSPASLLAMQVHCGRATLSFHGSLLQLRGTQPGSTPLVDAAGNVLLFNGQLFGGGVEVPPGRNDAAALLAALEQPETDVPVLLASLQGPWALAYWHAATTTLWFGRDPIGEHACCRCTKAGDWVVRDMVVNVLLRIIAT